MKTSLHNQVIRKLKSLAQKLEPMAKVGKAGLSDAFIASLSQTMEVHELVKVRFDDFKEEKKALSQQIAEKTSSELIWIVGHVAVFYRQNPDPAKRKIALPEPKPAAEETTLP